MSTRCCPWRDRRWCRLDRALSEARERRSFSLFEHAMRAVRDGRAALRYEAPDAAHRGSVGLVIDPILPWTRAGSD